MDALLHSGIHWSLINFSIFVSLLFFFLKKPVKEFWESRAGRIRFEIEEGEKIGREAKSRHENLRKAMSRLEAESRDLVLSLEREGELEKKQLMEEGKKRSDRLKEDGLRILDQEARKARESLKGQVASLALETAERMVRENLKAEDQKRLSDDYMAGLERQSL
ncbi:MAG TPA: ATP synthase F0 subunit B [bacterium]|nr:ATP synthase F0 subunit B [bacterium]